jgi:hypothetical protein
MSIEKPEMLGEDEAHAEANMLRVKLKEIVHREPTSEDYDKALQAVEEMKRLAEEEPAFAKVLHEAARIGNRYFQDAAEGLLWALTLGKRPDERDLLNREEFLNMFEDAASQLEVLKKDAESYGVSEGIGSP